MRTAAFVLLVPFVVVSVVCAESDVPPSVRFIEIGNGSKIFWNFPVLVDVEFAPMHPFDGTLEIVLATTRDSTWRAVNVSERSRGFIKINLGKGETQQFHITLPTVYRSYFKSDHVALLWRLRNSRGLIVVSGREPIEIRTADDWWRENEVLVVTDETSPGTEWLEPADAYRRVSRYRPFTHTVIGIADYGQLSAAQQQALFDATAMGMILILCDSPKETPSKVEPLRDYGQTIWRSDDGSSLHESEYSIGLVRRLGMTVSELEGVDGVLRDLVLSSRALQTELTPLDDPDLKRGRFWDVNHLAPEGVEPISLRWARKVQSRQIISAAVVLAFLLWAAWMLHRITTPNGTPSIGAVTRFCSLTIITPFLIYTFFARLPAGNHGANINLSYTGSEELRSVTITRTIDGGGGGTTDPVAEVLTDNRSTFVTSPDYWYRKPVYRTVTSRNNPIRLELDNVHCSAEKTLAYEHRVAGECESAWDAELAWKDGHGLIGRLAARRDLHQAVLLAGKRAIRLGNITAGTAVDLMSLNRSILQDSRADLTSSEFEMVADAHLALRGMWWRKKRDSPWLDDFGIAALDTPGSGNIVRTSPRTVFQSFHVAVDDGTGTRLRRTAVPWSVDETDFEIWIPSVLEDALDATETIDIWRAYWVGGLLEETLMAAWSQRMAGRGLPPPDDRTDGFLKYTLELGMDSVLDGERDLLYVIWNQREDE